VLATRSVAPRELHLLCDLSLARRTPSSFFLFLLFFNYYYQARAARWCSSLRRRLGRSYLRPRGGSAMPGDVAQSLAASTTRGSAASAGLTASRALRLRAKGAPVPRRAAPEPNGDPRLNRFNAETDAWRACQKLGRVRPAASLLLPISARTQEASRSPPFCKKAGSGFLRSTCAPLMQRQHAAHPGDQD